MGGPEWFFWVVLPAVLLAWWLHWRAAKTAEVRLVLVEISRLMDNVIAAGETPVGLDREDDPQGHEEILDSLIPDLHDNRLAFRCKAVLADSRRAFASRRVDDAQAAQEHIGDALDRIRHLERLAFRRS